MEENNKKRPGQTGMEVNKDRRTKRFEIRLTNEEWATLQQRAVDAGSSSTALFARAVLLPEQHLQNREAKAEHLLRLQLLASLGKIGSNVNQIARSLNRLKIWNDTTRGMFQQLIMIQEAVTAMAALFRGRR
jgi:hypothetical protein